jgi:hypothetical protein
VAVFCALVVFVAALLTVTVTGREIAGLSPELTLGIIAGLGTGALIAAAKYIFGWPGGRRTRPEGFSSALVGLR